MVNRDHEEQGKMLNLAKTLPFMSAFPFNEYEIEVIEKGEDLIGMGISPLLINEFGDNGKDIIFNFLFSDPSSNIIVSFHIELIKVIALESSNIKKFDYIVKNTSSSLNSKSLLDKIKALKENRSFLKKFDLKNLLGINLEELFFNFLEVNQANISKKIKSSVLKLSETSLESIQFSENQFKAIESFLNFQLHLNRILVGIVIAEKIY
jgi:hypothetical protein